MLYSLGGYITLDRLSVVDMLLVRLGSDNQGTLTLKDSQLKNCKPFSVVTLTVLTHALGTTWDTHQEVITVSS